MAKNNGKNTEADLAGHLAAGLAKHFAGVVSLTFGKGSIATADLSTQLLKLVALRQAVTAAQAVAKAKLVDEQDQAPAIRAIMIAFVAFVRLTFANAPDVLADFGIAPKKVRTPLTAEQKAAANAKRKATLAARGIVGSQKRKAVKGAVTGVTVTPIVGATPAAPTGNVAPAPTAPAAAGTPAGGTTPHTTA